MAIQRSDTVVDNREKPSGDAIPGQLSSLKPARKRAFAYRENITSWHQGAGAKTRDNFTSQFRPEPSLRFQRVGCRPPRLPSHPGRHHLRRTLPPSHTTA